MVVTYFVREGVTIDSLHVGQYDVEGLYLKLDKKLILKIDKLTLPKQTKKADETQIETLLERIKLLPRFFSYIELDKVQYGAQQSRVIYRDDVIYLSADAYEVAGMLEREGSAIRARIPLLHIKKYNFHFSGDIHYDYHDDILLAEGNYTLEELHGHLKAKKANKVVHFRLNSGAVDSLDRVLALTKIKGKAKEWVTKRIVAKDLVLHRLEGDVYLGEEKPRIDWMSLEAEAHVGKGRVRFHDALKHRLLFASAEVKLKKNVLYVTPDKPAYAGRDLSGSSMVLSNLLGKGVVRRLHLDLSVRSPYDTEVVRLLKAYKVTLPFEQYSGELKNRTVIDMKLAPPYHVRYQGDAEVIRPGKGRFFALKLLLKGGRITYNNTTVMLKKLHVKTDWLDTVLSGKVDLPKKQAKLQADVVRMALGEKEDPFFFMKGRKGIPVQAEWSGKPRIDLPRYHTRITLGAKGGYMLVCDDITPLQRYVKLPVAIKGGTFRLKSPDGVHMSFSGKTTWPKSYLYDKKGPIRTFPFSGKYNGRTVTLDLLGGRIRYDGGANILYLHDLNIDAKKLLDQNTGGSGAAAGRIRIKGKNCLIRYEKYVLLTDRFDLRSNGKNTTFIATKDGDNVHIELNGNMLVVRADRIKAPMLRALIHFGGLRGGRYSLDLRGNIKKTLRGVITIQGGVVSSFKTYNNMIALFNTVPALASLSDPGFSQQGFEVRSGRIEFRIVKDRIYFDMIYIDGKSAAISGKGTVSTRNGAINMDLAVRTARGIGKLIGSLPIVGYILMGKDKSITTGVKITGTLENPKVTTHVVLDTLLTPFKMFVRTIKSPAHIINE